MGYVFTLSVPWLPVALNKKLRSNRFALSRENKAWDLYIASMARDQLPGTPLAHATLYLTRHSHRTLDFDGLVGSLKPVVDALVDAGVISDDTWNVTGAWIVDQKFRPKKSGPLLEIKVVGRDY